MTEQEYINVSDRVKISAAINLLRDITPEVSDVIPLHDHRVVMKYLREWEQKLFKNINTKMK